MSSLIIRKKSLKTWLHIDSVLGQFIISKFYFSADGLNFQIVEQGQSKRVIYNVADITLYDDVNSGGAETFSTITELSLRLEQLNYPAFQYNGQITSIANLINEGTNINITGSGTEADPYVINATGGGGGSSTLQDVTDNGNETTNDVDVNKSYDDTKARVGQTNSGNTGFSITKNDFSEYTDYVSGFFNYYNGTDFFVYLFPDNSQAEDLPFLKKLATYNQIPQVAFGLKPIIITDPLNEFCTDLATARTQAGYFGFPTPLYDYYNTDTKQYLMFYNSSYIQDILVTVSSDTGDAFGYNNAVSLQDESGFVYQMNGNAFARNQSENDIIIKKCAFPDNNAFNQLNLSKNAKVVVNELVSIGTDFAQNFGGRIEIGYTGITDFSTAFVTNNPATLSIPKLDLGVINTIGSNLKSTLQTNTFIVDGVERKSKVYKALLTQSGTDVPTFIELENTLGEVTYSYSANGLYYANSDGLFTENKTLISTSLAFGIAFYGLFATICQSYEDDSNIVIQSFDSFTSVSPYAERINDLLYKTPITIEVFF